MPVTIVKVVTILYALSWADYLLFTGAFTVKLQVDDNAAAKGSVTRLTLRQAADSERWYVLDHRLCQSSQRAAYLMNCLSVSRAICLISRTSSRSVV